MDAGLLAQAVGIGMAVAAPVGPMCLLCIQHALDRGVAAGLGFGAGIAAADAVYAALGAAGIAALTATLIAASGWLQLIGGLVLIGLGLHVALADQADLSRSSAATPHGRLFASAFLLTLANPPTILSFAAVYAALGSLPSATAPVTFTVGVFAGSFGWWLLVTLAVTRGARLLTPMRLRAIRLISGCALIAFGGHALWQAVQP